MADSGTLAKLTKLVISQWLPENIGLATQSTMTEMDKYISRRMLAGANDATIIAELRADMTAEVSRVFGSYPTQVSQTVYGAVNIAGTHGSVAEIADTVDDTTLLRWQTTGGDNVCPDCSGRHGQEDTMQGWTVAGLPGEFGSRCQSNCQCQLVSTDIQLEPIIIKSTER